MRKLLERIRNNKKFFIYGVLLILVAAIVTRLYQLGVRPLHHDEGMLAYFAWKLASYREYIYTPQIHGPILFYIGAAVFKIFGESDFTVRLPSAIFSIILVILPFCTGKLLSGRQKFILSIFFLFSPLLMYFGRFLVHTAIVPVFVFLFLFNAYGFARKPSSDRLIYTFLSLALTFGVSEVTYIILASFVAAGFGAYLLDRRWGRGDFSRIFNFFKTNPWEILKALVVFILAYVAIYSVFFTSLDSLIIGVPNPFNPSNGLGFWLVQHSKRLGGQPWYYYFILFALYEPLALFGYLGAVIYYPTKKRIFPIFLILFALFNVVIFSVAGEKFPWLALNSLVPLYIISAYFIGEFIIVTKGVGKIIFFVVLVILIVYQALSGIRLSFINSYNTNEMAVYVQTPKAINEQFKKMSSHCAHAGCILIDKDISWPMSYVFRDNGNLFDPASLAVGQGVEYIIAENRAKIDGKMDLNDWDIRDIQLRDWWVPPDYPEGYSFKNLVKYVFLRQIWTEHGGYSIIILQRKNLL